MEKNLIFTNSALNHTGWNTNSRKPLLPIVTKTTKDIKTMVGLINGNVNWWCCIFRIYTWIPLHINIFSIQQVLRSRCNYLGQTLEFVDYMEVAVSSISGWCLHTSKAFQSSPLTKEVKMMFPLHRHLNNQGHIWYWQWSSTIDGDLYFVHLSFEFRL